MAKRGEFGTGKRLNIIGELGVISLMLRMTHGKLVHVGPCGVGSLVSLATW